MVKYRSNKTEKGVVITRYLVVNGSPRKGNTWKLAIKAMEAICQQEQEAELRIIHLAEAKLPFCCGCSNCFRMGGKTCPHDRIMKTVLEAMEWADGWIVLSPTFGMGESGLLKNLFDHMAYLLHRPMFFTKKALIITTAGGVGARRTAKEIAAMLRGIGVNHCDMFSVPSLSWNAYQPGKITIHLLREKCSRFIREVQSGQLHAPGFGVLIPYNLFRGMARYYVKGTEYGTEDGVYWQDKERRKGVYDKAVKVPWVKRLFGETLYLVGIVGGKRCVITYKK